MTAVLPGRGICESWPRSARRLLLLLGAAGVLLLGAMAHPPAASAAWGEPNGCGPGGWVNDVIGSTPYNDQFRPACDLHDWCYGGALRPVAVGAVGSWATRLSCDTRFRTNMRDTCTGLTCLTWAEAYYDAVRTFGAGPYADGQHAGMQNLLPNPFASRCGTCAAGNTTPTVDLSVRGSTAVYWKLDAAGWVRISCTAWDVSHLPCASSITLTVAAGPHVLRVKAVDYYTGAVGKTWPLFTWTT
jgi:hypothetical protein